MKKLLLIFIFLQNILFLDAYEKIRDYNTQISFIFNLSNKFIVNEMGTIEYPENKYKIYKITYNNTNAPANKKYLIISCIHGLEIAPVYAMKDFILYLDSKNEILNNITIDFIYILNPYGFEHNIRYNEDGKDLNRDFVKVETQEIELLLNNVKHIQYTGIFDFHEHSATKGFLLYYYSKRNKKLADDILNMISGNNITLENDYVDVILKAKNGKIYVPFYAKWYFMVINKQATTGLYFDKINTNEVFVFETPVNEDMEKRKLMIDLLLKYLIENDRSETKININKNIVLTIGLIIGMLCVIIILRKQNKKRTNCA
jgi:hypothetical protein